MTVTIVATVARAGKWRGSRCHVQIPTFTLWTDGTLRDAVGLALRILDPHADALCVSIGAVDAEANYIGAVAERETLSDAATVRYTD